MVDFRASGSQSARHSFEGSCLSLAFSSGWGDGVFFFKELTSTSIPALWPTGDAS